MLKPVATYSLTDYLQRLSFTCYIVINTDIKRMIPWAVKIFQYFGVERSNIILKLGRS